MANPRVNVLVDGTAVDASVLGALTRAEVRESDCDPSVLALRFSLVPRANIDEAVHTLLQTSQGEFPVVDDAGKPIGVIGRADLIRAIKTIGPDASVADAMGAEMPTVSHRATLEQAFKLLQQKQAPAVGVVDAAGTLVGLVTGETIAEMMMLQDALPRDVKIGPWSRPAGV